MVSFSWTLLVLSIVCCFPTCWMIVHTSINDSMIHLDGIYVLRPSDPSFADSLPKNYACRGLCPHIIVKPITNEQVVKVLQYVRTTGVPLVVRGGGHAYTCQSTAHGALMMDMSEFSTLQLNEDGSQVTVGAGLVWDDVLKYLKKKGKEQNVSLRVVHGQCTQVGVAGFALHGGVHFGGLSELYGLASDNILSLTVVVANGSVIQLSADTCVMDEIAIVPYSTACSDLWFALRGAGSSYAVVTSLTFHVHHTPMIHSALTILTLSVPWNSDKTHQQQFLSTYLEALPVHHSITLFGLDAYFKAYFFLLKFAKHKHEALLHDAGHLLPQKLPPQPRQRHRNNNNNNSSNNNDNDRNSKHSKNTTTIESFSQIHFIVESSWIGNDSEGLAELNQAHDHVLDMMEVKYPMVRAWIRPWLMSEEMWSVPSYDAVWGSNHAYGGASMTVGKDGEHEVLQHVLDIFAAYTHGGVDQGMNSSAQPSSQLSSPCSDCVTVIHRIGEGFRQQQRTTNKHITTPSPSSSSSPSTTSSSSASSTNPSLMNATLWIEIDCGHFYKSRHSWTTCSAFIDAAQRWIDHSWVHTLKSVDHTATTISTNSANTSSNTITSTSTSNTTATATATKTSSSTTNRSKPSHYPNVPNLITANWEEQYYGENYPRLQRAKLQWDPTNMFSHPQSIRLPVSAEKMKEGEMGRIKMDSSSDILQYDTTPIRTPSSISSGALRTATSSTTPSSTPTNILNAVPNQQCLALYRSRTYPIFSTIRRNFSFTIRSILTSFSSLLRIISSTIVATLQSVFSSST